jgi:hypothetical protein
MKRGTAPLRDFHDWIAATLDAGLVWAHQPMMSYRRAGERMANNRFRFALLGGTGQISIAACQLTATLISAAKSFAKSGGRK